MSEFPTRLPYLIRLGQRLAEGLAGWSADRRDRHANYVLGFQQQDGGFTGREGDSDLYYTSFAVRGLVMLSRFDTRIAASTAGYLKSIDWRVLGVIDLMNWLASALAIQAASGDDLLADVESNWREQMVARLEQVRTADGGYAKSTEGAAGSTYHTFLVMLAYQLLGLPQPKAKSLVQFLFDRQRDDGGFVEIGPMRRSGTNPTAAAAAILHELGYMDPETRDDIRGFLTEVRGTEGGFQANSRVPFCDSLSSFTGLLTCQDLGFPLLVDPDVLKQWVETQLEFPTGGFRAAAWDQAADVEYTFYGLGLLALIEKSRASH